MLGAAPGTSEGPDAPAHREGAGAVRHRSASPPSPAAAATGQHSRGSSASRQPPALFQVHVGVGSPEGRLLPFPRGCQENKLVRVPAALGPAGRSRREAHERICLAICGIAVFYADRLINSCSPHDQSSSDEVHTTFLRARILPEALLHRSWFHAAIYIQDEIHLVGLCPALHERTGEVTVLVPLVRDL